MEVFCELGRRLDVRWREYNYDELRFPELAVEAIESTKALAEVRSLDVLRWIAREPALPTQHDVDSDFSDLALSFYETPRFFVSVLFWMDGSTAIHQHGFSGAFGVLDGSSLHSRYRFHEKRFVNGHFRLGELELDGVDLLSRGSVHPIESHGGFIHSLFHLERPSLSLVVRTRHDPVAGPQWSYNPPGVAIDPFFRDPVARKKLEAMQVLLALAPEEANIELAEMLASADLHLTYQLLDALFGRLMTDPIEQNFTQGRGRERFDRLLETSRRQHGDVVDLFVRSSEEARRKAEIIEKRSSLTRPEQRFLLALLLSFPGRETVLELLAERYPDRDPVEEFLNRVQDLATTRELGSSAPNVLGIPDFDVEHRVVLRRLLLGGSVEEAAEDLVAQQGEDPAEARGLASQIAETLTSATLLRALFHPM